MGNPVPNHGKVLLISVLAAGWSALPGSGIANDLKTCMTELVHQVNDSMTIS
jgi:hypothetical protein